jgi:predicted TIM-barrel fold metal-dependent hydrolase
LSWKQDYVEEGIKNKEAFNFQEEGIKMIIDAHYHLYGREHWKSVPAWEKPLIIAGYWKGVGDGLREFEPVKDFDEHKENVKALNMEPESVDALIERMDNENIDYCVCAGLNLQRYWDTYIPNEWLAKQVSKYPNRLLGFVCIDPLGGKKSVNELRHYIKDLGMKGLKLLTSYESIYPADPRIDPLYEECIKLDIVVQNHTGWSLGGSFLHEDPRLHDEVGMKFPELKYQLVHTGYQSYYLAIMLMLKHPNFWGDLAWWYTFPISELVRCIKLAKHYCVLDKLMWATDNRASKPDIERLKSLPKLSKELNISPGLPDINKEDIELILGKNAQRLYRLE